MVFLNLTQSDTPEHPKVTVHTSLHTKLNSHSDTPPPSPPGPIPPPEPSRVISDDDQAILTRIAQLITPHLTSASPPAVARLTVDIASALVVLKENDQLGPWGRIDSENIFLAVGYQGVECYMGLMVQTSGENMVRCFFQGELRNMAHLQASPERRSSLLELGFSNALKKRWDEMRDAKIRGAEEGGGGK